MAGAWQGHGRDMAGAWQGHNQGRGMDTSGACVTGVSLTSQLLSVVAVAVSRQRRAVDVAATRLLVQAAVRDAAQCRLGLGGVAEVNPPPVDAVLEELEVPLPVLK